MNLGIKKDLVAKAGIPVNPPLPIDKPNEYFKTHEFPIVTIESVTFLPNFETTDRNTDEVTTQPVLQVVYKDTKNTEKKLTSTYYPLDPADEKFDIKLEGLQKSIKHIFEESIGADKFEEEDFAGTTFAELFENIAKAFNKFTFNKASKDTNAEPKVIKTYTIVPLYLKTVYYNSRLQVPMYPNFVQKATRVIGNETRQVPCELLISKKDVIVNKADAKPASSARDRGFGGASAFGMVEGADDMVFPDEAH